MSGHNKNKGFSQTSKRWDGDLKAQHQQSRNKQADHPRHIEDESESSQQQQKNLPKGSKGHRA